MMCRQILCIIYFPMSKKNTRRIIFILLMAGLSYGIYYAWFSFPIISGYNAKMLCSCVYVEGRKEAEVKAADLSWFPLSLGSTKVDWKDSSVTGSVFGLARRTAIFRRGAGCTMVNSFSEKAI